MAGQILYQAKPTTLSITQDKQTVEYVDINVAGDGSCLLTAALGGVFFNAFNSDYQMPEWLYKEILRRSYELNDLENLSQYNQLERVNNLKNLSPFNRLKRAAQAPAEPENNPNKIRQIKKVYQFIVDAHNLQYAQQKFMEFARQLVQEPEGWSALLECLAPAVRHEVLDCFKDKVASHAEIDTNDILVLESEYFVKVTRAPQSDQILAVTLTDEFKTLYGHQELGDNRWLGQSELRSFGQLFNIKVGIYNPTYSIPANRLSLLPFAPINKDKICEQTIILSLASPSHGNSGSHYHLGIEENIHKKAPIGFNQPTKPISDYQPASSDEAKSPAGKISASLSPNIIEEQYKNFVKNKYKDVNKDADHIINILLNKSLDQIFSEDDRTVDIDKLSAEEQAKIKEKKGEENQKKIEEIFATAEKFHKTFSQTYKKNEQTLRDLYNQFNKYQRSGTFFKSHIELQSEQSTASNSEHENDHDNSSVSKSLRSS